MGRARHQSLWLPFALAVLVLAVLAATVPIGADVAGARPSDSQGGAQGILADPTPDASLCEAHLSKVADPDSLILGDTTDVTMVVTQTCPAEPLPVDLVLIADQSRSMNRGMPTEPLLPTRPPTPDPEQTPTEGPPPTPPGGDPGNPGDPSRSEPPFCNSGGVPIETRLPDPTATRWTWRTPTPGPPTRVPSMTPRPVEEYEGDEDNIREVKMWVRDFVGQPEIERDLANGRLRIGCTSFNRRSLVKSPLSSDGNACVSALSRMRGAEITRPQVGFREAERILDGAGSRVALGEGNRLTLFVVLSDFEFCQADMRRLPKDVTVMTAGFGVRDYDRPKMYDLASERSYVSENHRVRDTVKVYDEEFVKGGSSVSIASLTVSDELADAMSILPNTIRPPTATLSGQMVEWQFVPPTYPITVGYAAEPLNSGAITVSNQSGITWVDTLGRVGSAPFPEIAVNVVAYTPTNTPTFTPTFTPTNTPTSTNTPTPIPDPIYLPILFKLWPEEVATPTPIPTKCIPEEQTVDVAMVIDTSTSMLESTQSGGVQKLQAAIDAAAGLVAVMKTDDQMAVFGFNTDVTALTLLTSEKATITQALNDLPNTSKSGTAINKALRAGQAELTSERHLRGNSRALILLTDGQQTDPSGVADVRTAADELRAAGITVVTIGIGDDVDADLLRYVATKPEMYFHAPRAEDLKEIYNEIAPLIPCG